MDATKTFPKTTIFAVISFKVHGNTNVLHMVAMLVVLVLGKSNGTSNKSDRRHWTAFPFGYIYRNSQMEFCRF